MDDYKEASSKAEKQSEKDSVLTETKQEDTMAKKKKMKGKIIKSNKIEKSKANAKNKKMVAPEPIATSMQPQPNTADAALNKMQTGNYKGAR